MTCRRSCREDKADRIHCTCIPTLVGHRGRDLQTFFVTYYCKHFAPGSYCWSQCQGSFIRDCAQSGRSPCSARDNILNQLQVVWKSRNPFIRIFPFFSFFGGGQGRIDSVKINPSLMTMKEWLVLV